jgi:type VI secretion system protein VasD
MIPLRRRLLLVPGAAMLVSACASPSKSADASYDLYLDAGPNVNRDNSGRPSPVLVGLYGLKSTAAFDASDFTALQDHAKNTLADDLISFEQVILLPGERKMIRRPVNPAIRSLGVVAGFRDLNKNVWKTTLAWPAHQEAGFFALWPSAPERIFLQMKLGESGVAVTTLDWAHR